MTKLSSKWGAQGLPTFTYPRSISRSTQFGFTLIELVVVIILVGILATVAMPRFFTVSTFQQWGFNDELSSAIRFANKLAIATGCDTRVLTTVNSYVLNQRASCDPSNGFTQAVKIAGGDSTGYSGSPPTGLALSAVEFYFDSVGRPRDMDTSVRTAVVSISVGSTSITVEPETGFVH